MEQANWPMTHDQTELGRGAEETGGDHLPVLQGSRGAGEMQPGAR